MTESPESAFHAYARAFETLDPEAVLQSYLLPCMFIAPQGVFAASSTPCSMRASGRLLLQSCMSRLGMMRERD
jgi:hypothetical protein